jgi:hypothetical protein
MGAMEIGIVVGAATVYLLYEFILIPRDFVLREKRKQ